MKRLILCFLCVLLTAAAGCKHAPPADETQAAAATLAAAPAETQDGFFTEEAEGGTRYSGGGISIVMEDGFTLQNSSEGILNYTNGYVDVLLSRTDDYDSSVLATYGYDMATLTEEDYGAILIDSNQLDAELFYDAYDNVCMLSDTTDSDGNGYVVYNVVKKAPQADGFWLLQFIAVQFVYDAYKDYLPVWAASAQVS